MKVHNATTGKAVKFDKKFGWFALERVEMLKAIRTFLDDGVSIRLDVLPAFLERLEQVLEFVGKPGGGWKFYASSLLFVYDERDHPSHPPLVCMIDFAHANKIPNESNDEGYAVGVRNMTSLFKELIEKNGNL